MNKKRAFWEFGNAYRSGFIHDSDIWTMMERKRMQEFTNITDIESAGLVGQIQEARKKTTTRVIKMSEDFVCHTLEGDMKGKAGGYLAIGVKGEVYPIDAEVFDASYEIEQSAAIPDDQRAEVSETDNRLRQIAEFHNALLAWAAADMAELATNINIDSDTDDIATLINLAIDVNEAWHEYRADYD